MSAMQATKFLLPQKTSAEAQLLGGKQEQPRPAFLLYAHGVRLRRAARAPLRVVRPIALPLPLSKKRECPLAVAAGSTALLRWPLRSAHCLAPSAKPHMNLFCPKAKLARPASAAAGPPSSRCSASAVSAATASGTLWHRGHRRALAQASAHPHIVPATKAVPSAAKTPAAARLHRHAGHDPAQEVHADANCPAPRLAAFCTAGCAAAARSADEVHALRPTPPPHALPSARRSTTGHGGAAPGTIASMGAPCCQLEQPRSGARSRGAPAVLSAGTASSEVGARSRGAPAEEVWNVQGGGANEI